MFRDSLSLKVVVFGTLAVAFGCWQAHEQPYKMGVDNTLRLLTEQHIVIVTTISGALLTEAEGGEWGLQARLWIYDILLITSFLLFVIAPLIVCLVVKVARVQRLMSTHLATTGTLTEAFERATATCIWLIDKLTQLGLVDEFEEELEWSDDAQADQSWVGVDVRMAYARFRVGLASESDKQALKNYCGGPQRSGLELLSDEELRQLLIQHYTVNTRISDAEREQYLDIVNSEDHATLIELCWSEGVSSTKERDAPLDTRQDSSANPLFQPEQPRHEGSGLSEEDVASNSSRPLPRLPASRRPLPLADTVAARQPQRSLPSLPQQQEVPMIARSNDSLEQIRGVLRAVALSKSELDADARAVLLDVIETEDDLEKLLVICADEGVHVIPPDALLAQDLFRQVDTNSSGTIAFDEFSAWWLKRQVVAQGQLDEAAMAQIKTTWGECDLDGSGELNVVEFGMVLSKVADSEWRRAVDPETNRSYFYNSTTRETRWVETNSTARVAEFLKRQGFEIVREDEEAAFEL